MKHPKLQIVKTEAAQLTYGDYGADSPQGAGEWSYRTPAVYQVTGPTGRIYTVTGSGASFMQSPVWSYERAAVFDGPSIHKGGFRTMADCLDAIEKLELYTLDKLAERLLDEFTNPTEPPPSSY